MSRLREGQQRVGQGLLQVSPGRGLWFWSSCLTLRLCSWLSRMTKRGRTATPCCSGLVPGRMHSSVSSVLPWFGSATHGCSPSRDSTGSEGWCSKRARAMLHSIGNRGACSSALVSFWCSTSFYSAFSSGPEWLTQMRESQSHDHSPLPHSGIPDVLQLRHVLFSFAIPSGLTRVPERLTEISRSFDFRWSNPPSPT